MIEMEKLGDVVIVTTPKKSICWRDDSIVADAFKASIVRSKYGPLYIKETIISRKN